LREVGARLDRIEAAADAVPGGNDRRELRDELDGRVYVRKSAKPRTIVRSTSIGQAVFGTFCIALMSGSGSERREPSSRLS
jgi:hypothetical protein